MPRPGRFLGMTVSFVHFGLQSSTFSYYHVCQDSPSNRPLQHKLHYFSQLCAYLFIYSLSTASWSCVFWSCVVMCGRTPFSSVQ